MSIPFNSSIARCASSCDANSTNPNPRERPPSRSQISRTDVTRNPLLLNNCCNSSFVISDERCPTYSFVIRFPLIRKLFLFQRGGENFLKRSRMNSPSIAECGQGRQHCSTANGNKCCEYSSAETGKSDQSHHNSADERSRNSHRNVHGSAVALAFQTFAGQPAGTQPDENPNRQ